MFIKTTKNIHLPKYILFAAGFVMFSIMASFGRAQIAHAEDFLVCRVGCRSYNYNTSPSGCVVASADTSTVCNETYWSKTWLCGNTCHSFWNIPQKYLISIQWQTSVGTSAWKYEGKCTSYGTTDECDAQVRKEQEQKTYNFCYKGSTSWCIKDVTPQYYQDNNCRELSLDDEGAKDYSKCMAIYVNGSFLCKINNIWMCLWARDIPKGTECESNFPDDGKNNFAQCGKAKEAGTQQDMKSLPTKDNMTCPSVVNKSIFLPDCVYNESESRLVSYKEPDPNKPGQFIERQVPLSAVCGCRNINNLVDLLVKVANALMGIVGAVMLVMFMYGGFTWLTSGGSAERVKTGVNILKAAVIGLIIIFAAQVGMRFVLDQIIGANVTRPAGTVQLQMK